MAITATKYTLDEQIKFIAKKSGLSEAQLKTVYLRGVNNYVESDVTTGSATMYGLARVMRFINERGAIIDTDLVEVDAKIEEYDHGFELSAGAFFSPDVVYASGKEFAAIFEPGVVTSITVSSDFVLVAGYLSDLEWEYALDTVTGASSLTVS
jgi:hypothetical protein